MFFMIFFTYITYVFFAFITIRIIFFIMYMTFIIFIIIINHSMIFIMHGHTQLTKIIFTYITKPKIIIISFCFIAFMTNYF